MSPHVRHLTTEAQREQFHLARRRGGMCAACGRRLDDGEPVYVERFTLRPEKGRQTWSYGPVGAECASPESRQHARTQELEPCAGCGRPVSYRVAVDRRRRALCSKNCAQRASVAGQRQKAEG